MTGDGTARLAATIEVLSGAVQFLLAERVSRQPEAVRGELLRVLQRALSVPAAEGPEGTHGRQAERALWVPIVATTLIDDVRRQLGREPEGVTHIAPAARTASEPVSEVAERAGREIPDRTVGHAERGQSAA